MSKYASIFLLPLLSFFTAGARHNPIATDSLQQKILALNIPGLTITGIQYVNTGAYQPPAATTTFTSLPAFCLVAFTLKPTPASNIRIERWMPQGGWNGRFLGTGNGGGAGRIVYDRLAQGLKKGYATANTDMGTSPGVDAAIGHPERWADFGHRSTHLMTVVSKQIIAAYYGKAAHHAYFVGCSTSASVNGGFFRYFLIPGMGHCGGGPGINDFGQNLGSAVKQDSEHDVLMALVKWVEQGVAPDHIIATALDCCNATALPRFQRPVYPYPVFPEYIGGDPNIPSSYKAADHQRGGVVTPAARYLQ